MIERVHEHIISELGANTRTDTIFVLTAIVLNVPAKDKQALLTVPDLLTLLRVERKMLAREAEILRFLIDNGPRWRDDPRLFSPN